MADKHLISADRGVALKTRPDRKTLIIIAAAALALLGLLIVPIVAARPADTPETAPSVTAAPAQDATYDTASPADATQRVPADTSAEILQRAAVRRDGFPLLRWDVEAFVTDADGRMRYTGGAATLTGIDVSEHQGEIDWSRVAADGVDFAIIRVGRRGSTAGGIYEDEYFRRNIAGATAAGLRVGVYFYSQAIDEREAAEEAAWVLEMIAPYEITFPVVFDWEIVGGAEARTYTVSRQTLCAATRAFCGAVAEAGYEPMIYFTRYLGYRKYILRNLTDYGFWYAEYEDRPRTAFDFDIWQYSDTGRVDGIDGDVDLNIYFLR